MNWEAVYSTGLRVRISAADVKAAFTEAWTRAPIDAEGVEIYGLNLCGVSARPEPDDVDIFNHYSGWP